MKRYIISILALVLFVAGTVYVSIQLAERRSGSNDPSVTDTRSLDAQIVAQNQRIKDNPDNPDLISSYISLSNLYLQKVRETADVAYYVKIDELLRTAEKIDPHDAHIFAVRAHVANGRHNFSDGLRNAAQAVALRPETAGFYGPKGDAELELGKYDEAVKTFQTMVNLRPDFASYSRISYIREINGDIKGAKEALLMAIGAGSPYAENKAWAYVERGKLEMRTDLSLAENSFNTARAIVPLYAPAFEGLGKVAFARGEYGIAIDYFLKAFEQLPIAQYAIALGEVYEAQGDMVKAKQQFALAELAFQTSVTSGVNIDLENALFLADHDTDIKKAFEFATKGYADRPSIFGADVLAWAQYKKGDYGGASKTIKKALQRGEYDPLIVFHAGMIALKNGERVEAQRLLQKALALNPYFSFQYSAVARDTLGGL